MRGFGFIMIYLGLASGLFEFVLNLLSEGLMHD